MIYIILSVLLWAVCGFIAWGLTIGSFTHRYPAFRHGQIAAFGAAMGPFGLVAALIVSPGGIRWRIRPMTQDERWRSHKQQWPSLPYQDFLDCD